MPCTGLSPLLCPVEVHLGRELAFGRRVHALSVKSGYEGGAFLATHRIRLYSSDGSLEEAVGVFRKVHDPTIFN